MENTSITSGSITVENPFILTISGSIAFGALLSGSGAIIACNSGAIVNWVEVKKE